MEESDEIVDFGGSGAGDGALLAGFEGGRRRQDRRPRCVGGEGGRRMRFHIAGARICHERSALLLSSTDMKGRRKPRNRDRDQERRRFYLFIFICFEFKRERYL